MPRPSFEEIQDFYRNGHKAPRPRQLRAVVVSVVRKFSIYNAGMSAKAARTVRITKQA